MDLGGTDEAQELMGPDLLAEAESGPPCASAPQLPCSHPVILEKGSPNEEFLQMARSLYVPQVSDMIC